MTGFEGLSLTLSAQDVVTWWRIVDNRATRITQSGKFGIVNWSDLRVELEIEIVYVEVAVIHYN